MTMQRSYTMWVAVAILMFATRVMADEAAAINALEKMGGTVRTIAQNTDKKEAAFHLSGKEVTDDGLANLASVNNIVWLNLRGTQITNAGLAHLADLTSLTRLHLEKTSITDEGLAHLAGLENLEYLNLYGTKVTDEGLKHLKSLGNLKKLYVWQTDVTEEGATLLASIIPDLYINRGADTEVGPPTRALALGRYVKVSLKGEKRILSLAEVQVIETASGKELQVDGAAIQSSDYEEAAADRAHDGKTDGAYENESVSHTTEETDPWWLLDLGAVQDIGKIVIYNRSDCCGDRLKGAVVEVYDRSLAVVWTGKVEEAADGSVSEFVDE